MWSPCALVPTPRRSMFPPHITPSATFRPRPTHQPFRSSTPVIVTAGSRPAFSPFPIASALQSDAGSAASWEPIQWEECIEQWIYRCRFLTIFGVLGSLIGSVLCYLKGCVYVMNSFTDYFSSGGRVVLMLVEAIDVYLIGTVMLVFGMGLYELFISNFDFVKASSRGSSLIGLFKLPERPKWLEIQSVNELKTKVGHVLVLALLVGLFDKSKKVTIASPKDLLCFAASVLLSSGCLYLLSMLQTSRSLGE